MAPTDSQQQQHHPFAIKDCALIAIATGRRALTLKELRDTLHGINADSLYYHFWGGLLQPRFEEREYNNDLASWVRHSLHDGILAERLAVVDPTDFRDIETLRQELLELVEERLEEDNNLAWVRGTKQFEFIRSQIVVFDTGRRVTTPEELAALMPRLSVSTIFYHFIDARRRSADNDDDFRFWLGSFGERYANTSQRLAEVDPYFAPLSEIRNRLNTIFSDLLEKGA